MTHTAFAIRMTGILLAAILIIAAIGASTAQAGEGAILPDERFAGGWYCAEDDPCWNWAKMGNHRRGVILLDGTPKVVGPCGFNRLWAHGAIRYRLSTNTNLLTRLKGDKFARTLTDCPWRTRESKPFPWHQSPADWADSMGYND